MLFQVSAIINVGWKPDEKGDEWIRKGDYMTDTVTTIDAHANESTILKDIPVKKYA